LHHFQARIGGEQVTAPQDDSVWANVLLDFAKKCPSAWAVVALHDGSPVHSNCGNTHGKRPIQDLVKSIATFRGIVHPTSHFNGHWNVRRDDFPSSLDNLQCYDRLADMISTPASAEDFFDWATKIDINHCEPRFNQFFRPQGKLLRFRPHQLTRNRLLFLAIEKKMLSAFPLLQLDKKLVQHNFAKRIGGAVPTRDQTHRPIAVPTQGSLDDRKTDIDSTDFQWAVKRSRGRGSTGGQDGNFRSIQYSFL
jgi:hypothetical protein